MILTAFSYKNFKYTFDNFKYLYVISIFLGGFLYFLNTSFSYKNVGLIFFHNGLSINIIFIIIASPIILILYIKNNKKLKEEYSKKYKVSITLLNDKKLNLTAFLDTGNNMYDPYKNRPIILINKAVLKDYNPPIILVPCKTINKSSLIPCFKIKELVVNDKIIKDSSKYLNDKFIMAFEIGYKQGKDITKIVNKYYKDINISVEKDYSGRDRFVFIWNH